MAVRFENLKPLLGSRVVWDDRADLFTPAAAAAIRAKVEARTVVVFPQLHLSDNEQLLLTDLMGGRLNFNNTEVTGHSTENDVYQVTLDKKLNPQSEYVLGTFFWHMDGITVDIPPPFASLLSARRVAAQGGQTEFASTYAAYEGLPDAEKREIDGLRAVHSVKAALRHIADAIPPEDVQRITEIGLVKEHPLVWTHQSGRKSLIIGTQADHIVGMTIAEGRALLLRLQEWAAQPDFSYCHQWDVGDFVIWDNTGAMHRVRPYAENSGRMMHRTSLAGHEEVM